MSGEWLIRAVIASVASLAIVAAVWGVEEFWRFFLAP